MKTGGKILKGVMMASGIYLWGAFALEIGISIANHGLKWGVKQYFKSLGEGVYCVRKALD